MTKFFIILIAAVVIFYIATYPYPFKLARKLRRVLSFNEITHIENIDFDYERISSQELEESLIVERRAIKSKRYIDEELEYIVIKIETR